jgi:hypothetical protein
MGLCGQLLDKMVTGRAQQRDPMKLPDDGYGYNKRNKLKTVDAMTL